MLEEIKKALEGVTPGPWEVYSEKVADKAAAIAESAYQVEHTEPFVGEIFMLNAGGKCPALTGCGPCSEANARYIAAVNPAAISELLSTIESLQREKEALKKDRYDLAYAITGGEDAPGLLDSTPTSEIVEIAQHTHRSHIADIDRAEEAEAEVKRLRNKVAARALTDAQLIDEVYAVDDVIDAGFGEGGGSPGEWWYERADELEHERKRRELESQLQQHNSRTALASTGGEHHAE